MSKQDYRIVTFNIRYGIAEDGENAWSHRKGGLFQTLQRLNPDVLAVQEALSFQEDEIKQHCPHLDHFGLGRYHSTPCDRSHENLCGEKTTLFFRPDRLVLRECGTFWHSDTPEVPGSMSWGNDLPRTTTWGIFGHHRGELAVFNNHFHWGEPYCFRATQLLREKVLAIAEDRPIVILGDFNLSPESETYGVLTASDFGERVIETERSNSSMKNTLANLPLVDAWTAAGQAEEDGGTYHGFTGIPEDRIDWILISGSVTIKDAAKTTDSVNRRYPSDHFPVTADIAL